MKIRGDFLEPPHSTDKTTLIIKVIKVVKIRNRYNQVPRLTKDSPYQSAPSLIWVHIVLQYISWADPEGGGGGHVSGPPPSEKSQKYRIS